VERNRGELGFPQSLDRAERSGFACLVWSRFLHQVWVFFWEGRGEKKGGKDVEWTTACEHFCASPITATLRSDVRLQYFFFLKKSNLTSVSLRNRSLRILLAMVLLHFGVIGSYSVIQTSWSASVRVTGYSSYGIDLDGSNLKKINLSHRWPSEVGPPRVGHDTFFFYKFRKL
jgi:hypothetical protein